MKHARLFVYSFNFSLLFPYAMIILNSAEKIILSIFLYCFMSLPKPMLDLPPMNFQFFSIVSFCVFLEKMGGLRHTFNFSLLFRQALGL